MLETLKSYFLKTYGKNLRRKYRKYLEIGKKARRQRNIPTGVQGGSGVAQTSDLKLAMMEAGIQGVAGRSAPKTLNSLQNLLRAHAHPHFFMPSKEQR